MQIRYLFYILPGIVMIFISGCMLMWEADRLLLPEGQLLPAKGLLLVAGRHMQNKTFRRSVILLIHHGRQGTVGVIINRPSHMKLAYRDDASNVSEHRLFYGGPVARGQVSFLIRGFKVLPKTDRIIDGVRAGLDESILEEVLAQKPDQEELRLYSGHTGWAVGQLQHELERGDWHLLKAIPAVIFTDRPKVLWKRLIDVIDPPGMIVKSPKNKEREIAWGFSNKQATMLSLNLDVTP